MPGANNNNSNAASRLTPGVTTRQFLAAVVPWSDDQIVGFVNVHKKWRTDDGKTVYPGHACSSVSDAEYWIEQYFKEPRDIYFCTSLQSDYVPRTSKAGKPWKAARRDKNNVVALKSLWLDIDYGKDGHGKESYKSRGEAETALAGFVKQTNLPEPSFIVHTGGGLHVYFTLSEPITRDAWQPYADALAEATRQLGLNCDAHCTVDAVRILRVPGTFNHKTNTPRPVEIVGGTGEMYSLDRIKRALEPYVGAAGRSRYSGSNVIKLPDSFMAEAAARVNARYANQPIESLSDGIKAERVPIDLDAVAAECPFIKEALDTGGKDFVQPLWNLSTLISTFTVGGRDDAHRMANGHSDYTQGSTDELFDRKSDERQGKNLGWPSCKAISTAGCKSCASCPHFAAHKSPLNLASPSDGDSSKPQAPSAPANLPRRGSTSTRTASPWGRFRTRRSPAGLSGLRSVTTSSTRGGRSVVRS